MKILVISDTHRKIETACELIKAYQMKEAVQCVIHCGDHLSDAKKLKAQFQSLEFYSVPGNCDYEGMGSETDCLVEIEGVNFYITHGHRHHVKYGYEELLIDGKAHDAQMIVFGHTHCALKEKKEGIVLLNPGSLTLPRDTIHPSFAVVEVSKGQIINVAIHKLSEVVGQ